MPHICIHRDLEIFTYSQCFFAVFTRNIFSHAMFWFYNLLRCSLLLLLFVYKVVVLVLELRALEIYANAPLLSYISSPYWGIFNEHILLILIKVNITFFLYCYTCSQLKKSVATAQLEEVHLFILQAKRFIIASFIYEWLHWELVLREVKSGWFLSPGGYQVNWTLLTANGIFSPLWYHVTFLINQVTTCVHNVFSEEFLLGESLPILLVRNTLSRGINYAVYSNSW